MWRMKNGIPALIDLSAGIFFVLISGLAVFWLLSRVRAIERFFVEFVSEQVAKTPFSGKGGDGQ